MGQETQLGHRDGPGRKGPLCHAKKLDNWELRQVCLLKQEVTVRFGGMQKRKQKRERLEVVHTVSALKYSFERRLVESMDRIQRVKKFN